MDYQYYPTPENVVEEMLFPYFKRKYPKRIIDPSAGEGHILDFISERYLIKPEKLFAIEIQQNFRYILSSKKYTVVDSDFLKYNGDMSFDLFVMNPPFNNGTKHLLKAWNLLDGGDIVCLLNSETLNNPHTRERELLVNIIKENGSVEHIGSVFTDAERKTEVDVCIVRLHKEIKSDFDFSGLEKDNVEVLEEETYNQLASADMINSLVAQYNAAVKTLKEKHKIEMWYYFYVHEVFNLEKPTLDNLNEMILLLKTKFWGYVFNKTKVGEVTTSNFQKKFFEYQKQTEHLAFTEENIYEVLYNFMENKNEILNECLLSVFDRATAYHEKNKVHTEGWKTNKSYRVNSKIIVPWGISHENRYFGWQMNYYGNSSDFYRDLDKVCCMLSGKKYNQINSLYDTMNSRCSLINRGVVDYTEKFDSEFFTIRVYKKGTVHLVFRDEDLCDKLNIQASRGKGWLGGGY